MRKLLIIGWVLVATNLPNSLWARAGLPSYTPVYTPADATGANTLATTPTRIRVDQQTYESSIAGLRRYLDGQQATNPTLYAQLNPSLLALEDRQMWAWTSMLGGTGLGTTLIIGGYSFLTTPKADSSTEPNLAAVAVGSLIVVGGVVTGIVLMPNKQDLSTFINQHNQLNSAKPLQMSWGLRFDTETTRMTLNWNF